MTKRPLSRRDRRALAAVAAQFFVNGAMTATFIAQAPQIRDQIGVEIDEFGRLLTIAGVFGLLASLAAGRVIDTCGTYRVLGAGAVVMVVALSGIGLGQSVAWFLMAMIAYVILDAWVDISMNLQGSWISARRSAPVMNRLHGTWSLGGFTGGLAAVAANSAGMSLATHFVIVSIVTGIILAAITRGLLRIDEDGHDDTRDLPPAPAAGRRARLTVLAALAAAGLFALVVEMTSGDFGPFRLTDDFGASPAAASAAFVAFAAGMSVVRMSGDFLQIRLGRHGLHLASVVTVTIGLVLAALIPDPMVSVIGFALVGAGVATFLPILYDDAARAPGRRGAGLGAMTAGTRLAILGTPAVVGGIAGTSWSVGAAIAVVTLPCVAGFAVITELTARQRRRRQNLAP